MTWWDPFGVLGGAATKVAADAWRAMWLSVWNSGLYIFRVVLQTEDHLLTPDISEKGPGGGVFGFTFWIAAVMVVIMAAAQIGLALVRRDGTSLGRVLLGVAQFVMVWAAWLSYGAAVLAACGGLNEALMKAMFGVTSWEEWQPWEPFTGEEVTEAVVATVLGILGLVLWLAAIAHFMVLMARAGALLVMAATTPISAAGLVSDIGKAWFWKSLRWFHAAAFTPVLMTLVTGLGLKIADGVAAGDAGSWQAAVGTALPAVMMVLIAAFAPLSLFKLLAFVEPGTNSGGAVRSGLAAVGGLAGLLGGTAAVGGIGSAAESDGGRSQGEAQGEDATSTRFASAQRGMATALGPVGQAAAPVLRAVAAVGAAAAAIGVDATNQMGVGHNTYHPDFASGPRNTGGGGSSPRTGVDPAARAPDAGEDNHPATPLPDPSGGWGSEFPGTSTAPGRGLGGAAGEPPVATAAGGVAGSGAVEAAAVVVV